MRILLFCHSLLSDWCNDGAHFLRGMASEWQTRGHRVTVYEPRDAWSLRQLIRYEGMGALRRVQEFFPQLEIQQYVAETLDLSAALAGADLVLVEEWNEPALVQALGRQRANFGGFRLFFHDAHHRAVSSPGEIAALDLSGYDGVLAAGQVLREIYLNQGWAQRVWTWHEAADARLWELSASAAGPARVPAVNAVFWTGQWGDAERAPELNEFLLEPVRALRVGATVHGPRYPAPVQALLAEHGVRYGGWLSDLEMPAAVARHRVALCLPSRRFARMLPGVPTGRLFSLLASGAPVVCAPWEDREGLFTPGTDYLVARDGREMRAHLHKLLSDPDLASQLGAQGRATMASRHTCAQRADALDAILAELAVEEGLV
ncbi:MAG: glycosyltransferase [Verrucomicrobia bacterium]|nr:glycosyltransferase [Verrucomicrobiota bacterium]